VTAEMETPTKQPTSGKLKLNAQERQWISLKWKKIRAAQVAADAAGNTWRRLNKEIEQFLDNSNERDIVQRASIKSQSLPLKDALETGKWHAAEAQRHIDDVNLFLHLKQLEVL